jgi:hypothetical protein
MIAALERTVNYYQCRLLPGNHQGSSSVVRKYGTIDGDVDAAAKHKDGLTPPITAVAAAARWNMGQLHALNHWLLKRELVTAAAKVQECMHWTSICSCCVCLASRVIEELYASEGCRVLLQIRAVDGYGYWHTI